MKNETKFIIHNSNIEAIKRVILIPSDPQILENRGS